MDQFLLQAAPASGGIFNLLLFPALLIIMYFFFIRPQQKRQKDQTKFQNDVSKGEEVVTLSGIIGRINKIEGETVTLEVDTKSYIRVLKSAISKDMTEAFRKGNPVKTE